VAFDDALTEGESDPGPGCSSGVQALEHLEDPVRVVGVDTDALVPDGDDPVRPVTFGRETSMRGGSSPLYSIALLRRFWNTWRNWLRSPITREATPVSTSASLSSIRTCRSS